jgi:hypothetical protein
MCETFLSAYRKVLEEVGLGVWISPNVQTNDLLVTLKLPNGTMRAVHNIQQNISRQATAEQGAEAARAVLKEIGWPDEK